MEIYVFMGPGTGLRQVFGFCAIAGASAHSLPIRITAFSQRDSLRGAGPWSQHISLMPRSVELFLTPSPAWHSSLPTRQIDRQTCTHTCKHIHTHTHTAWPHHTAAQKCKVASYESYLLLLSVASNWHQLWKAVSCGKDVNVPACCKNTALECHYVFAKPSLFFPIRVQLCTSRIYLFGSCHERSMCSWLEVIFQE